ncbi:MAG: LacI family DNA-binding transcriptional regulator [bacterium]
MRDVAALAEVGLKTVSRVFNDVPTVDPLLVTRVRSAAAKLGYRPNLNASSLRRGDRRTATIGLLLEDVANPFSGVLHRAVEDVARARNVLLLTGSVDEDPIREQHLAQALIDRRVDGLIIVPVGHDHSYLILEQRAGTPIVFVDREPSLLGGDAVVSANQTGASDAVRHLLSAGHRRIGYLGDLIKISTARDRFRGYCDALAAAGLPVDEAIVRHGLTTVKDAEQASNELLRSDKPPTALFASQNLVTIGAVRALRDTRTQDRTALVGFDDFLLADLLQPAVTVVRQDVSEMGKQAALMLFDRIDGVTHTPQSRVLPTTLIPRGSGEIAGP